MSLYLILDTRPKIADLPECVWGKEFVHYLLDVELISYLGDRTGLGMDFLRQFPYDLDEEELIEDYGEEAGRTAIEEIRRHNEQDIWQPIDQFAMYLTQLVEALDREPAILQDSVDPNYGLGAASATISCTNP